MGTCIQWVLIINPDYTVYIMLTGTSICMGTCIQWVLIINPDYMVYIMLKGTSICMGTCIQWVLIINPNRDYTAYNYMLEVAYTVAGKYSRENTGMVVSDDASLPCRYK